MRVRRKDGSRWRFERSEDGSGRRGNQATTSREQSSLYAIVLFIWFLETIFTWSDYIYVGSLIVLSGIIAFRYFATRYISSNFFSYGVNFVFIAFWAGITVFDNREDNNVQLSSFLPDRKAIDYYSYLHIYA